MDPSMGAPDEQPIDLSKSASRTEGAGCPAGPASPAARAMFVKKRWLAQSMTANNRFVPLSKIRHSAQKRAHEMSCSSFTTTTTTTTTTEESTSVLSSRQWELEMRLDRANSVPYLSALPPLQRQKSLSESRIPPKAFAVQDLATVPALPVRSPLNSTDDWTVRWLIEHQQELQRQRMQQMDILQQRASPEPTEINLNYYSKVVQFMHTLLPEEQRLAQSAATKVTPSTVEEDDGYDDNDDEECPELADIDYSSSPSQSGDNPVGDEACESKRKAGHRPMTGKHVRPGTGAKPSTLLELRKKIQARQQLKQPPAI